MMIWIFQIGKPKNKSLEISGNQNGMRVLPIDYMTNFKRREKGSKIYSIKLPNDYQSFLKNIKNKKFINEFTRTKGKFFNENKVEFHDIEANDINFGIGDIVKQKAKNLEKRKIKHILDRKMISILNKIKESK